MIATGGTVGLAEWIIDDTCLVSVGSLIVNGKKIMNIINQDRHICRTLSNVGKKSLYQIFPKMTCVFYAEFVRVSILSNKKYVLELHK